MDTPRDPDPVYSMRLIDQFDNQSYDTSLTADELKQIEELEVKQVILQSKKDTFEDIQQKLNLTKSRIQEQDVQEKFIKLELKISQYLQSIDPIEPIDVELDQFIDWLCDKTIFSRYKYKGILKSVFISSHSAL